MFKLRVAEAQVYIVSLLEQLHNFRVQFNASSMFVDNLPTSVLPSSPGRPEVGLGVYATSWNPSKLLSIDDCRSILRLFIPVFGPRISKDDGVRWQSHSAIILSDPRNSPHLSGFRCQNSLVRSEYDDVREVGV